jgi:hypothetical protein
MAYRYKLKEQPSRAVDFQQERIKAFDDVEVRLNNIYKLLSQAKKETLDYYNDNPDSYNVVYSTDLMLDYLDDIQKMFEKPE